MRTTSKPVAGRTKPRPKRRPNVVSLLALRCNDHDLDYLEYCVNTWRHFCRRHGALLHVQEEPLFDLATLPPTWQKLTVFAALDRAKIAADKVAIVDIDTMVHWRAPDLFELAGRKLAAVPESTNDYFIHRTLREFQPFFRGVKVPWYEYFNSGVLVFNQRHRPVFERALAFFARQRKRLTSLKGIGSDAPRDSGLHLPMTWNEQTPLNFIVRKLGVDLELLPAPFNLQNLASRQLIQDGLFIEMGHIWHFNGFDKNMRTEIMGRTWQVVRDHYRSRARR